MPSTKIVCTLGPATSEPEILRRMVGAGMDLARINLSHGDRDQHRVLLENVRESALAEGGRVPVLLDLQGPKIRTGDLTDGGPVELRPGQGFTIAIDDFLGDSARISTTYLSLPEDVEPGDRILVSAGLIELRGFGVARVGEARHKPQTRLALAVSLVPAAEAERVADPDRGARFEGVSVPELALFERQPVSAAYAVLGWLGLSQRLL